MNQPAAIPANALNAAWKKFAARVQAVRTQTRTLLAAVDQRKRERAVTELHKRINQ